MQSNTYIPQRYKSASNGLKNGFLHYVTKYGQICNPLEKLHRVQAGRTTEGSGHPNDLGLRQAERLTSFNKDLTEIICRIKT